MKSGSIGLYFQKNLFWRLSYVNTTEKTYTLMNVFLFVAWKQAVCFPYGHISLTVKMQKGCLLNGDKIMGQMYFG